MLTDLNNYYYKVYNTGAAHPINKKMNVIKVVLIVIN